MKSASVLVIDDSPTVRADLQTLLRSVGLGVQLASTIGEGRRALEAGGHSLVILDVLLPDGNGVDLLAEIKRPAFGAELPVILLTSETVVRDRVRGWSTGADDYVGKPYDRDYLVARVFELLGHGQDPTPDPRSVLVVEASPTLGRDLREALTGHGYSVHVVATAEEGLRYALAQRPGAAVVDADLPGRDGVSMVGRMRLEAALRHIPVILLTADQADPDALRGLGAGVDASVPRATAADVVPARLARLLKGPRTRDLTPAPSALGPKRLLLVDGDPQRADALAEALVGEGYELARATDTWSALLLFGVQPADAVIIRESGLTDATDLVDGLRERKGSQHTGVLVVGAVDDPTELVGWLNRGADDYVGGEALDLEVLRARVRALFRTAQSLEERRLAHESRLRQTLDAAEARASRELAEARAVLLADLAEKNEALTRANDLLAAERDRAERESNFKSRFLANMSHELRTPLNAIIGFSEILAEQLFGPLNERQAEYVDHVRASGRHLLGLINEVLDLSRIAAGRMELQREWVDVHAVAQAAVYGVAPLAEKAGITLTLDVDPELPYLRLDAQRLRQILFNLLSNGIKFTPRGGQVQLAASVDGDWVALAVRDTGIGIASEEQFRLFREFERIQSGLPEQPDGTGLGLALSKQLVELMGGTLSVQSAAGEGSTFIARLPVPPAVPGAQDPAAAETRLPERPAFLHQLAVALARAARTDRAVHLTLVRLPPGATAEQLAGRLLAGDLAGRIEPGVVASYVEGVPKDPNTNVERRLSGAVADTFGAPPRAIATVSYPFDAVEADSLLARGLERLGSDT